MVTDARQKAAEILSEAEQAAAEVAAKADDEISGDYH